MHALRLFSVLFSFILLAGSSLYSEEKESDPIANKYIPQCEKLKADYDLKLKALRQTMISDYEQAIKTLTEKENLDRANELQGQLDLLKSKIEGTDAPANIPKLSSPDPVQKKYQGKLDALKIDFDRKLQLIEKAANSEYDAQIKRISQSTGKLDKVNHIKEQQKALGSRLRPNPADKEVSEGDTEAATGTQILHARERFKEDRKVYSESEMEDIEKIYQDMKKIRSQEERKPKLEILLSKYPKANRTGAAVLIYAYRASGKEREKYLQLAIDVYSDCAMGNGFLVGPWARYLLAKDYNESGDKKKVKLLTDDIKTNYPDALNPNTKERLVDLIDQEFGSRKKK